MIITLFCLCFLWGCKRVIESPLDELTLRSWYVVNESGISASLAFYGDNAELVIYDKGKESAHINGVFAADEDSLYITSKEYCKTFCFDYRVYSDRCEIIYGKECLVFYPSDIASNDEVSDE